MLWVLGHSRLCTLHTCGMLHVWGPHLCTPFWLWGKLFGSGGWQVMQAACLWVFARVGSTPLHSQLFLALGETLWLWGIAGHASCMTVGCCMCGVHTSAIPTLLWLWGIAGCACCTPVGFCMCGNHTSALPWFTEWDGDRGADENLVLSRTCLSSHDLAYLWYTSCALFLLVGLGLIANGYSEYFLYIMILC